MAVLRVAGDLDTVTAPALETAVQRCLAAQPDAVVLDVADLDVRQPEALSVLPAMAQAARRFTPAVMAAAYADLYERVRTVAGATVG